MANANDKKIMELKQQIEVKRDKLAKSQKFVPITNCSLELDGVRHSIQVLNKEQLISAMVRLNSYVLSAKDLGVLEDYTISGYHVQDWVTDLRAKLDVVSRKEEESKLKAMEAKLTQYLSNEKKISLELDGIEAELKG
jgi:hypothetical protein